MSISKFTSKVIGDKRRWREYKARIERLPAPYRDAVTALERYINHLGGLGDADSFMSMFDDLADLFERAAADGTLVREIVGADPVEFVETFLSNYPRGQWISREQERLTTAITRVEADQAS